MIFGMITYVISETRIIDTNSILRKIGTVGRSKEAAVLKVKTEG